MFKKILCLVIAIMLMLTCVGCDSASEEHEGYLDGRFDLVATGTHNSNPTSILVDKETGVMYLHYYYGVTVMFDADGKPLLWEG